MVARPRATKQALRRGLAAPLSGAVGAALLAGCAINITAPADNAVIVLPAATHVAVSGNASYSGLKVTVDGVDFSGLMASTGPSSSAGDLPLAAGNHTVVARADVACSYCAGGTSPSSSTRSFVVMNPATCVRAGGPPVITLDPGVIAVGRTPGRQKIGFQLENGHDALLILVDDAPGLAATSMRVAVDIDPFDGVTGAKEIEAWGFCHLAAAPVARVQASVLGGVNVGTACDALADANDFRSGCTTFSAPMMLDQFTTSELWLRKSGLFGTSDVEAIDASIWQAFGGRSVRFIWRFE